jgi:hypothetical protein
LTRPDCLNPAATPSQREQRDQWRAEVLERVAMKDLAAHWRNRVQMRRAAVYSSLAFAAARRAAPEASRLQERALDAFAHIQPAELAEDDLPPYNEAAMRSNAALWLRQAQPTTVTLKGLQLRTETLAEGGSCLSLYRSDAAASSPQGAPKPAPLWRHCGWGLVQTASATLNREGTALAVAVQPLDGWRELWVLSQGAEGWRLQVLPPSSATPGLGYAEFAGWVPGGQQLLVAREARAEGRYKRSFEVLNLADLSVQRQSPEAAQLGAFQRWQDAAWKSQSLILR